MVNKSELKGITNTLSAILFESANNPSFTISCMERMVWDGMIGYKDIVDISTVIGLKCLKLHRDHYSVSYKECYIEFMKVAEFYYKKLQEQEEE